MDAAFVPFDSEGAIFEQYVAGTARSCRAASKAG
jgi:hypothetical protein